MLKFSPKKRAKPVSCSETNFDHLTPSRWGLPFTAAHFELLKICHVSCLFQLQNNLVTKLAVQQAEGGVGKWIAGALKLILLIDVWTWPEGLTSGANCKLDFFFFFIQHRLWCCVACLSSLYHHQQRNHLIYRYYELYDSECAASPGTSWSCGWRDSIKAERRMETKEEACLGCEW